MPHFLQFRTANGQLRRSSAYDDCQSILLDEEIRNKRKTLKTLDTKFGQSKQQLHGVLSYFDFLHTISLFLDKNTSVLEGVELRQNVKLSKLLEENVKHDPRQIIHNYSSQELTPDQESILIRGLNFATPPKKLKYEDFMLPFELLYRDIKNVDQKEGERVFAKNELRNIAFSSFKMYNKRDHKFENISQVEQRAFLELIEMDNIIIQKADKGNVIVIVEKTAYVAKMESILSDESKFKKVTFCQKRHKNNELDYLLEQQEEIIDFLKELVDCGVISDSVFNQLKPTGSQPGVLYGLCKVHKGVCADGSPPPFRPILSAINTPSYKIAKFLTPLLSGLTKNAFVSKDSFEFARVVRNQNPDLFMASFDIDSLFTNVPLDETIDISVKKLFGRKKKFEGFTREQFKKLLSLAVKNSFFLFNGTYYEQVDGVAMGSPLGPTLANIFLCHWEEIWIKKCPKQFKPVFYNRYMDDTFLLFTSEDHVKKFYRYINSRHKNMSFTYETEHEGKLAFLDVRVTREEGSFLTSLYRKPTFSGLYSHYESFLPDTYKTGLIYTLLHRAFILCSTWDKFHEEVLYLRKTFIKNAYPGFVIDKCIKLFLDKIFVPKETVHTVPQKELSICLPFLGKQSLELKSKMQKFIHRYFPQCKIRVVFKCKDRLKTFLKFKDRVPTNVRSHLLYQYTCNSCNAIYIGKTRRHYQVRVFEHLGISLRTHQKFTYNSKCKNNSSILKHVNDKNCVGDFENFKIIGSATTDFHLLIKESLLINKNKPIINGGEKSVPLYLFE